MICRQRHENHATQIIIILNYNFIEAVLCFVLHLHLHMDIERNIGKQSTLFWMAGMPRSSQGIVQQQPKSVALPFSRSAETSALA
jgi:hypothetical protein